MSEDRSGEGSGYFKRFKRAAAGASDERAAAIERLEQALAEERARSAEIERKADGVRFQVEVLEKGYAKQLEEARHRMQSAERSLAERDAELAGLRATHETAQASLIEARAALQRMTAERDRLRRQIDGEPEPGEAEDEPEAELPEGTINRLIAAASRPGRKRPAADTGQAADDPGASDEMLPPELMFRKKDDET